MRMNWWLAAEEDRHDLLCLCVHIRQMAYGLMECGPKKNIVN